MIHDMDLYLRAGIKGMFALHFRMPDSCLLTHQCKLSSCTVQTSRRRTVYSPRAYDDLYVPALVYPRHRIDTTGEENSIRRSVNDELVYTTHVVDDTYDLAAKSRNRDQEILRDANRAIPPSSADQTLPTASLKASAPPKPFRRFLDANSGRSHSQGNFEWKSPAARAYFTARDIRNSTFAPSSSSILSPYESPRSTPERDLGAYGRRKKHKVLGSKIRVRGFSRKYPDKRSRRPPELYLDAESSLSDGAEEYGSDDDYQEYANDEDDDVYSSNSEYTPYYYTRERSPSPSDYVPFTPRRMLTYEDPEDDVGYGSKLGSLPDLSVQPYYSRRSEPGDEGVADDILFHNVVAQTAAKARAALRDVNLDDYESASIVLSVEGEMKDPRKGGEALGFQYISRPIPLKGPMLAYGPGSYAATSGTDSAFDKYFSEMRSFREQVRQRLESGYQALRDASTTYRSKYYSASKALPYHSSSTSYDRPRDNYEDLPSYTSSYTPLKYRKRLEEESEDRLLLYPVSQRDSLPLCHQLNPHMVPQTRWSYVDTEFYQSPRAAVAARRARSHPPASTVTVTQQTSRLSSVPPRPVVVTAPPPYVRRPRQVVVVNYPKSSLSSASVNESIDKPAKAGGVVPWREYYRASPRKIFIDLPRGVMQKHMVIRTLGRNFVLPYHRYQYVPYVPLPSYFNTPLEPKPLKAYTPVRVLASPLPYKRRFSRKAALVGNKVDVVLPAGHRKRPKSKFAADVMREINLKKAHETTEFYESQAKAHWDEFGDVTKPKNLLSWKYRLDARMKPDDLLYQPTTYNTLHSRLRNVHDKMDRHRQLMDRYLDVKIRPHTEDVQTRVMSMYVEMERRNPLPPTGVSTKSTSDYGESRNTPVRLKTPAPYIQHRLRMSSEEPSKAKEDYKPMSGRETKSKAGHMQE
ncbi:hypothetical protein FSP39_001795 [Pinctada imbricata]|uniref:Uncharacterized protein n=1 Tax=Pinctada imbricata TaxID=66713 RepID=A0AA88XH65_PINIB|nr:hypothetical protein FSP39_001795 [Pinctada imbricata]